jgi:hypothetical protein
MVFMSALFKITNTLIAALFVVVYLIYPNEFEWKYYKLIAEEFFEPSNAPNVALGSSTIENFDFSVLHRCGEWRNLGVGNSKIASYIEFAKLLPVNDRVKKVIIYLGENDISAGITVDVVFSQYKSLISKLTIIYPNAIFHIIGVKYSPARKIFWRHFSEFNLRLKMYVSVNEQFKFHTLEKLTSNDFSYDGIHLNNIGYQNLFYGVMRNC